MAILKLKERASIARVEKLQHLLRQQPSTVFEIADALYISRRYADAYIVRLKADGLIYVSEYRREKRRAYQVYQPLYAWGIGADAPPPDRPVRVRVTEHRKQLSHEDVEKQNAKRRASRIQPHMDWSTAWIPRRAA